MQSGSIDVRVPFPFTGPPVVQAVLPFDLSDSSLTIDEMSR